MSDEPLTMRTRARPKSCLKITPPITPDLSAAPSPCDSGRTSPSMLSDSGSSMSSCRKSVSFCADDELEEVFFVDEWDRTPAAVTPKLTYQDVLELKQLRVTLPYTPPPPPPRQPFTTSAPSSSKPPFPISRFASTASHTPSKWKNRSEPADVDPQILPYLDAVPIRLLPLLPQSPTEPVPPSAPPEPHPQTPTPTASPETRPTIQSRDPPELRIEPVIPPSVSVSPPSPSSPTQLRRQGFSFLPLLPVQDPPPIPPPPPMPSAPTPPRRKLDMTFLPVNAVPEPASVSTEDVSAPKRTDDDGEVGTSTSAALPSPSSSVSRADQSPDAGHLISPRADPHQTSLTPSTSSGSDDSSSSPMSPPSPSLSLPILSAFQRALESDTETETDTYTDTDAESDAPSTSTMGSSLPSSPPCDDDDHKETDLADLKMDTDLIHPGYYPRIQDSDPGSYFPHVPAIDTSISVHIPAHVAANASPTHTSKPGQTPPLSVLYPSPRSQTQPLLPLDALACISEPAGPCEEAQTPVLPASLEGDAIPPPNVLPSLPLPSTLASALAGESSLPPTPLSLSRSLQRKLMLEALPSPALNPPSPFELEPLPGADSAGLSDASPEVIAKLESLRLSKADRTPVLSATTTPDDSPLLTLESMRASWDARARANLGPAGPSAGVLIAPSISRRRSSS